MKPPLDPTAFSRRLIPFVEEYYDQLVYEADPLGGYRLSAGQQLPHIRVNAYGYRGRDFTGSESMILCGDSVTFGVGSSSDEACFARFLEETMREPVADASVRAYRVYQHFMHLPHLLTVVPRARHLILWCGYADIINWVISGRRIEGMLDLHRKYGADRRSPAEASLLRRVAVAAMRHLSHVPDGSSMSQLRTGGIEELVSFMGLYLAAMRDFCAARGITFHVLLQPFIRIPPTPSELRIVVDGYDRKAREHCGQPWYEVAPAFVEAFKEEMARRKIRSWVDCQQWVAEHDFYDQVHLREDALQRIAQGLAKTQEFWDADTETLVLDGRGS